MRKSNENSRAKRGDGSDTVVLAPEEIRTHCVSTRMNKSEIAELDKQRAIFRMQRGECFRAVFFGREPKIVPVINKKLVKDLALIGSNINQLAKFVNSSGETNDLISEVKALLREIQEAAIGHKKGNTK